MQEAPTIATARATATDSPRLVRTLRWHFTDVAATYAHPNFLKPWQHRHSLWWWLRHAHDCTKTEADNRRVCSLLDLVRDMRHHQAPIEAYVKEHVLTNKWKRDRSGESQLALADFILYLLWKYCSLRGQPHNSNSPFSVFTLVCDRPSHNVFNHVTYLGLDEIGDVKEWTLEWTRNGYLGVEYWSKHTEELYNKGPLMTCLVPSRPEPSVKLSPVSSEAEEDSEDGNEDEDEDEEVVFPVAMQADHTGHHGARAAKRRRLLDTSEHRHGSSEARPREHSPATTSTRSATSSPTTTALASGSDESEEERVDALLLLLAAKERKIEVRRQLLYAEQTVRRARARLHKASQEDHHRSER